MADSLKLLANDVDALRNANGNGNLLSATTTAQSDDDFGDED